MRKAVLTLLMTGISGLDGGNTPMPCTAIAGPHCADASEETERAANSAALASQHAFLATANGLAVLGTRHAAHICTTLSGPHATVPT